MFALEAEAHPGGPQEDTYTTHQPITLYTWGWPIDTKGLADCTHIV